MDPKYYVLNITTMMANGPYMALSECAAAIPEAFEPNGESEYIVVRPL